MLVANIFIMCFTLIKELYMKVMFNYAINNLYVSFKNRRSEEDIKQEEDKLNNEEISIKKQIEALNREQTKLENEERKLEREMNELKRLEK